MKETSIPTELVNTARMNYSARQLAQTAQPIVDIALDCGLNNLSHFYALFRQRFGESPRKCRLQAMPDSAGLVLCSPAQLLRPGNYSVDRGEFISATPSSSHQGGVRPRGSCLTA
jgi:AraC-like DNA-binding protein